MKRLKRWMRLLIVFLHWRTLLFYLQWPYYEIRYQIRFQILKAQQRIELVNQHDETASLFEKDRI